MNIVFGLLSFVFFAIGVASVIAGAFNSKGVLKSFVLGGVASLFVSIFLICITVVGTSNIGIVTSFGQVESSLPEGLHLVAPWKSVNQVDVSVNVAEAVKSQAASKDLQTVHSDLTVNFYVKPDEAINLYRQNPSLNYGKIYVVPIMYETFKAVTANYTAEELLTKRENVSDEILHLLTKKLSNYHIVPQSVQMINFGFSQVFDRAIEEKVTASQRAETAKRDLERIQYESQQRLVQAEAEAKAIKIQAEAIDKQGGAAYVQLKAVEKWDGKLPQVSGGNTPFINLK